MPNERSVVIAALFFLALLSGCSSPKPPSTAENKPAETKPAFQPEFVTGREALQKMYVAARAKAADVKPYSLQSIATKEANGQDGKSGIWGAGFASPSRRAVRVFTFSGIKSDDAPEPGISATPEDTYNPANTSTAVFDMAFLKIDSDEALKTALKHGGDKLIAKDKETKLFYALNWNARESKLVWRILLGADQNNPKLAVDVDATSGTFMKVEK